MSFDQNVGDKSSQPQGSLPQSNRQSETITEPQRGSDIVGSASPAAQPQRQTMQASRVSPTPGKSARAESKAKPAASGGGLGCALAGVIVLVALALIAVA